MLTDKIISYRDLFDFIYDYIEITNKYLSDINIEYLCETIKNNANKTITTLSINSDNLEQFKEDIESTLNTVSNQFKDILLSPDYIPYIVLTTLRKYTHRNYLYKLPESYSVRDLTNSIYHKNLQIIDKNTILFINKYNTELFYYITKEGYLYSNNSIQEIINGSWYYKVFNIYASIKFDKVKFNGSKILYLSDYGGSHQSNLKELILSNLFSCPITPNISPYANTIILPEAELLFINNKNNTYIEFKELVEYCILTTIPNLTVNYELIIESESNHKINIALFNNKHQVLKTKYAKKVINFIEYLIEVYGYYDFKTLALDIQADDNVITPIDRTKMIIEYSQKYGKIEELYEMAGVY